MKDWRTSQQVSVVFECNDLEYPIKVDTDTELLICNRAFLFPLGWSMPMEDLLASSSSRSPATAIITKRKRKWEGQDAVANGRTRDLPLRAMAGMRPNS